MCFWVGTGFPDMSGHWQIPFWVEISSRRRLLLRSWYHLAATGNPSTDVLTWPQIQGQARFYGGHGWRARFLPLSDASKGCGLLQGNLGHVRNDGAFE